MVARVNVIVSIDIGCSMDTEKFHGTPKNRRPTWWQCTNQQKVPGRRVVCIVT